MLTTSGKADASTTSLYYTKDAEKMEVLSAQVIKKDGSVVPVDPKSIRITRSLDSHLGLDEQAIIAVKQWRFRPGLYKGQPVPVRVNVELTFTLR